jgi:hypothetical protein
VVVHYRQARASPLRLSTALNCHPCGPGTGIGELARGHRAKSGTGAHPASPSVKLPAPFVVPGILRSCVAAKPAAVGVRSNDRSGATGSTGLPHPASPRVKRFRHLLRSASRLSHPEKRLIYRNAVSTQAR